MLALYKETLTHLQPPTPSAIATFRIPSTNSWSFSRDGKGTGSAHFTESSFASDCLASDGSVYFRQAQTFPRSFLWRVLGDGQVLEVRSVDLVKSRYEQQEASKILRIRFPTAIIPSGITFADAEGHDYINAFVITENKELYTMVLQRDFFTGLKELGTDFYTTSTPSYFTLQRPFRIHANSPYELFISYENGTLQRLTRKAGDDGSSWVQHNFDEKAWSLRGIVHWQGKQSVKYNGRALDQSTALTITALSDSTHAFTVCLNHTLRVWNLTTGHLVLTKDLLDATRTPQELPSVSLNPSAYTCLRLAKLGFSGQTYVVTFSPHNEGYFKFWTVKNSLTSQLELNDAFPAASLRAPDPDPSGNSVWSMTGFEVLPTESNHVIELWVLWRNNNVRQLVSIKLNLLDVERSWNNDWIQTAVYDGPTKHSLELTQDEVLDPSTRWLQYLLRPGNYSTFLLETALTIYQDIMKFKIPSTEKRTSLFHRITYAVTSTVNLRKYAGSDIDYDRFDAELDRQWQNLWRIAENLRERQGAPVSLAVDPYTNLAWVVMADSCATIRECNNIEILSNNEGTFKDDSLLESHWAHRKLAGNNLSKLSALLNTASSFCQRLSSEMLGSCQSLLEAEMFQSSELPIPMQLASFYDTCGFSSEISDETYDLVMKCLDSFHGFQGLSSEIVYALLDKFPENISKPESQLSSTQFGQTVVSNGARDIIDNEFRILFELLMLVVFLECELNVEDTQNPEFDGAELFSQLQIMLREYSKKRWLVSNHRYSTDAPMDQADSTNMKSLVNVRESGSSLLHDLFVRDIRPQPTSGVSQSFTLTQTIDDVIAWTREHDNVSFEDGLVHIQCELLLSGDLELAKDFLRYQPATSWSTYVKGRLYLACADAETAAAYFQKAAHALARGKAIGDLHESSAGLLSVLDAESFYNGLTRYFQHISGLFETARCYPQAALFARLAIQSLPSHLKEAEKILKQDILARVFIAEIKCLRYRSAFMTLSQYTDSALQKSAMATLVKSMFSPVDAISSPEQCLKLLKSLPLGAHQELSSVVDKTLSDLAHQEQFTTKGSPSSQIERAISLLNVLHAWRLGQKDYCGAVQVLLQQMKLVKQLLDARSDEDALDLRNMLLAAINALACAPDDEAYVLTYSENAYPVEDATEATGVDDTIEGQPAKFKPTPQAVLTLRELRRDYQNLLDRHSRIERGDFDFAMDEDTD